MKIISMKRSSWFLLILSCLCMLASPTFADDDDDDDANGLVIQVAPPTGDAALDVANIQNAIDVATPGAVLQFGPGTYELAAGTQFVIPVDDITLQGHGRSHTTFHGVAQFQSDLFEGYFFLAGNRTTIRRLTFDGFAVAINIFRDDTQPTGHLVKHCTFRNGDLPIQTWSFSDDLIRVQKNKFVNVQWAIIVVGKTVHFSKNRVTAPNPESMLAGKPFGVGLLYPQFDLGACENNVFEDNKVVANADGFLFVTFPGLKCTNNVVRDNKFVDQRVWFDFDLGSMVILEANGGVMEGNIIEGNEADGSQGIGIAIFGATHNYIVDNEFEDFVPGDVLPGPLDFFGLPPTGVFLDSESSGNYVVENEFENVPNPIEDQGTDNIVEDNEVENDDDDDDD